MAKGRKDRTRLPDNVATEVLFAANYTCCVCRDAAREVQIHHIDENPTNHDQANLATLCFHDHNRTLVTGGFGRSLTASAIRQYRDDWLARVAARRAKADDLASVAMAKLVAPPPTSQHEDFVAPPVTFIFALPALRRAAIRRVGRGWSGSTVEMCEASREYVDALAAVLVALASYLPASEPEAQNSRKHFGDVINDRLSYHWQQYAPEGPGTGGSSVSVEAWAAVAADVERLVENLVYKLSLWDSKLVFDEWKEHWQKAGEDATQAKSVTTTTVTVPDRTPLQGKVLMLFCDLALEARDRFGIMTDDAIARGQAIGLSSDEVVETAQALVELHDLEPSRVLAEIPPHFTVTTHGFIRCVAAVRPDYKDVYQSVASAIVNGSKRTNHEITLETGANQLLVEQILELMAEKRFLHLTKFIGGEWLVSNPSSRLKELLAGA